MKFNNKVKNNQKNKCLIYSVIVMKLYNKKIN